MKFLVLLTLSVLTSNLALVEAQSSHQDRFLAQIVEALPPFYNTTRFMCTATVFTKRHLLTTAKCVEDTSLRIEMRLKTFFGIGNSGSHRRKMNKINKKLPYENLVLVLT